MDNDMNRIGRFAAISILMTALLAGCAVVPVERHYYRGPVMVAPPPPRVEYIGPPPAADYVWISGYWNWDGGRHRWVDGHWEAPRHGHHWVPHYWEHEGDHWRLHEGRWD